MRFVLVDFGGEVRPGMVRSEDNARGKRLVVYIGNYEPMAEWVPIECIKFVSRARLNAWYIKENSK